MKNYTFKVQEVKKETEDTVTLCFKQPGLKKIKYLAGQYLTLQFRINGRRYIRAYSFSSSPNINSTLDVTVKRVLGGIVSNYINDYVKVDDVIEVQGPLGDFIFEHDQSIRSVVFWGVGSGITPLFSMIKQLLIAEPLINIYLVYGNKYKGTVIFSNQLEELKKNHSERFKVYNFYSEEENFDNDLDSYYGRINSSFIHDLMNKIEVPTKHYICGPIGLKKIIKESLHEHSVSANDIFSEDFELVKNPKDFEDIKTRFITINFQGSEKEVEVLKGKSILESALDVGMELPYSCQTGSCSTCKGELKEGNIRMIGLANERIDLEKKDFLLCCSYPLSDGVYVTISN